MGIRADRERPCLRLQAFDDVFNQRTAMVWDPALVAATHAHAAATGQDNGGER
jgi:hypothetical protein